MNRLALARAYVVLFIVSTAFPIAASLMPDDAISRGMGILDVTVAFLLLVAGILWLFYRDQLGEAWRRSDLSAQQPR